MKKNPTPPEEIVEKLKTIAESITCFDAYGVFEFAQRALPVIYDCVPVPTNEAIALILSSSDFKEAFKKYQETGEY